MGFMVDGLLVFAVQEQRGGRGPEGDGVDGGVPTAQLLGEHDADRVDGAL
jgi:hypothetical protein